jgi:putative hydrolase of the HAD superfamily
MPLKAVIFDFGGVLVRTQEQGHQRRAGWEQRLGLAPGEAERLVFDNDRGAGLQTGLITAEAHWQWVGERLGLNAEDLAAFRRDFFAGDVLDFELLAYIDRLRAAGYHLGLLSNASDDARTAFRDRYPVIDHFDSLTLSCEEGVMKPDARIYEVALARAGARPGEAVFVDDVPANVEGAARVGMIGIRFATTEQAIRELATLTGVTPAPQSA